MAAALDTWFHFHSVRRLHRQIKLKLMEPSAMRRRPKHVTCKEADFSIRLLSALLPACFMVSPWAMHVFNAKGKNSSMELAVI